MVEENPNSNVNDENDSGKLFKEASLYNLKIIN